MRRTVGMLLEVCELLWGEFGLRLAHDCRVVERGGCEEDVVGGGNEVKCGGAAQQRSGSVKPQTARRTRAGSRHGAYGVIASGDHRGNAEAFL